MSFKTLRSPPASALLNTTQSEPDLNSLVTRCETPATKVTVRNKRLRMEHSPQGEPSQEHTCDNSTLKYELMSMLKSWKTEQDSTLSTLLSVVTDLKTQNIQSQKTFQEIEKSLEFMSNGFEDMKNRIVLLEKERQTHLETIDHLQNQVLDLQNKSRPSSIELRNIPTPDQVHPEDLKRIVVSVGKVLNTEIQASDLRDVYSFPGKPSSSKIIVAEFTSVTTKNSILAAARQYNKTKPDDKKLSSTEIGVSGPSQRIYVEEYLPLTAKKLHFQARQFAKDNNYTYCWVSNGRILLHGGLFNVQNSDTTSVSETSSVDKEASKTVDKQNSSTSNNSTTQVVGNGSVDRRTTSSGTLNSKVKTVEKESERNSEKTTTVTDKKRGVGFGGLFSVTKEDKDTVTVDETDSRDKTVDTEEETDRAYNSQAKEHAGSDGYNSNSSNNDTTRYNKSVREQEKIQNKKTVQDTKEETYNLNVLGINLKTKKNNTKKKTATNTKEINNETNTSRVDSHSDNDSAKVTDGGEEYRHDERDSVAASENKKSDVKETYEETSSDDTEKSSGCSGKKKKGIPGLPRLPSLRG